MLSAILLATFWSILTGWRIRLLARFFQLEEYKVWRFLRWWLGRRERFAPQRLIIAAISGVIVVAFFFILDIDIPAAHLALWAVVGLFAAWPEPAREVKKHFVATQRAKRLLATAFTLALFINLGVVTLVVNGQDKLEAPTLTYISLTGMLSFGLAPLLLILANSLMYPLEETLRWGFRMKARRRLAQANPVVIGVTGSYGKTSTKEYLAHILAGRFKVLATPKSFNTVMGICITINNELTPSAGYQYFIVEMGAYVRGEIKRICQLTHPRIGVVTAVGPQHLERFGSIENVVEAKYEIIKGLPPDGVAVFNWDDPRVREMEKRGYPQTRYSISLAENPGETPHLVARHVRHTIEGLTFDVVDRESGEERTFNTQLVGLHNITNILLATMVACHLGMSLNEIALRVASLVPAEHRLRRMTLPNGITILDDAYNTNPVGAVNAMQVLSLYEPGRRVLVTPGMVELGVLQESENEKLGVAAAKYCTDIILVGAQQTRPLQRGVRSTEFDLNHLHVMDTVQEAISWYQRELKEGDAILFLNDLADNYL